MPLYLNAGFGEPLGQETLRAIKAHGFCGIRQDVPNAAAVAELVWDIERVPGIDVLFLLTGQTGSGVYQAALSLAHGIKRTGLTVGRNVGVEVLNEPDIDPVWRENPETVGTLTECVYDAMAPLGVTVVTGGVSNLNEHGLSFIRRCLPCVPQDVVVGFHRYQTEHPPDRALPGYRKRSEEFTALREASRGRVVWCTETGYPHHEQKRRVFWLFKRRMRWTEEQVTRHLQREVEIQRSAGVPLTVVYQLNDGPGHEYGRRRGDGTWRGDIG